MKSVRTSFRVAIGIVIAAVFLWLAFGRVDWNGIRAVFATANPTPLVLGLIALAAGFLTRIVRWWVMLSALDSTVPLKACVRPFLVSLAINNTMPLRAGDIARAVGFRQALRAPMMRVVGTLLIERVFDLFVLVGLFFIGLIAIPRGVVPDVFVTTAALLGSAALVGLLVLLLAPAALRSIVDRVANLPAVSARRFTPRLREAAHHLVDTFAILQSLPRALRLLALSLIAWLFEGAMYACVAVSLHADGSAMAPWFAAATGTLATLIPSSPGYVGTFDYFAILAMVAFGVSRAAATAFAVVVHLMLWLPVTVVGAALLVAPRARRSSSPISTQRLPNESLTLQDHA